MNKKINKKSVIPIKYMLQIPIVKIDIKDEKGKSITDITCIQYYNGALMVGTADGLYTDKSELFNLTKTKKIM